MLTRHPPLTPPTDRLELATSRYAASQLIQASGLAPVAISLGPPKFPLGYELAGHLLELAPAPRIFRFQRAAFERAYRAQLCKLGVDAIAEKLLAVAPRVEARGCVVLCFEDLAKPDSWCHRRVLAEWLEEMTGQAVPELTTAATDR